ncbi:MAG: prolipoprotein diacylglyceryl transferase [Planctomycetota bacterium]
MSVLAAMTAGGVDHAWLHDLSPFVIRISGDFGLRWYGLSYVAGFAVAYLLLRMLARRGATPLPADRVFDAIVTLAICAVVGGRLGYAVFYQPSLLWGFSGSFPFWSMLVLTQGGMASHGGMIGVLFGCWMLSRGFRREDGTRGPQTPMLHATDLACLVAPPGLLLGRLANFVNGELLGKIVSKPGEPGPWWSVRFPQEVLSGHAPELTGEQETRLVRLVGSVSPDAGFTDGYQRLVERVQAGNADLAGQLAPLLSARHPSQLYQAVSEGLLVGIAVWAVARWRTRPGVVTGVFLIVYGAMRIVTEFYRLPDAHLEMARVAGLSRGQWLSVAMIAAGVSMLVWRRLRAAESMLGWGTKPAGDAASA